MPNALPRNANARPLNSWMAFRSYYHGLFNGVQQKHASTYLNILWQKDPFKAKWAVVAKTYTMIKNKVGKRMAPLDTFLQLTCPKMGIIAMSDYLQMLNWIVTYDNGVLNITQIGRPTLNTFDGAVVGPSMNHIDLLQYVLDSGYLDEVDSFTHDVQYGNTHMLISAATMFPDQAKAAFTTAIQNDPKGVAAAIFGMDVNHKFLEISTSPSAVPIVPVLGSSLEDVMPVPIAAPASLCPQPSPAMAQYPWTGSMSELYKPSEIALDFDAMMANDEWMVTDITDPLAMDNYLEAVGGYKPDDLYADQFGEPTTMIYQFNDSF